MARCRKGHTADLGDELKRPIHRYRVDGQEDRTFVHPVVDPVDGRVVSAPEGVCKDGRGPAGRGEEYERVQGAAHAQAGAVDEDPVKGQDGKLGKVETRVEEVAGRILKLQFWCRPRRWLIFVEKTVHGQKKKRKKTTNTSKQDSP